MATPCLKPRQALKQADGKWPDGRRGATGRSDGIWRVAHCEGNGIDLGRNDGCLDRANGPESSRMLQQGDQADVTVKQILLPVSAVSRTLRRPCTTHARNGSPHSKPRTLSCGRGLRNESINPRRSCNGANGRRPRKPVPGYARRSPPGKLVRGHPGQRWLRGRQRPGPVPSNTASSTCGASWPSCGTNFPPLRCGRSSNRCSPVSMTPSG